MKVTDKITVYNCDNLELLSKTQNNSIDIICIDPPYLYLKNQKLERHFDFEVFFSECKRVLTENGFIIMFGRGASFYRMNTVLDDLGFIFKEEIVWKKQPTSPVMAIGRVHETISIFSKGGGIINRVKVPFFHKNKYEPEKILEVVKRLSTTFGNRDSFRQLKKYYENGELEYYSSSNGMGISLSSENRKTVNRTIQFARTLEEGITEQSIIQENREHYSRVHPTQKPPKLLIRLINLVLPPDKNIEDIIVADFFGGSYSTMRAVYEIGCQGVSCEIDKEYHEEGIKETLSYISNNRKQIKLF